MSEANKSLLHLLGVILLYFLPVLVAIFRRHLNAMPIMLVNLVLGWTIVGWFVAFIWSTTSNVKSMRA